MFQIMYIRHLNTRIWDTFSCNTATRYVQKKIVPKSLMFSKCCETAQSSLIYFAINVATYIVDETFSQKMPEIVFSIVVNILLLHERLESLCFHAYIPAYIKPVLMVMNLCRNRSSLTIRRMHLFMLSM
jgi:hypothetical protein